MTDHEWLKTAKTTAQHAADVSRAVKAEPIACRYFALCENEATLLVKNPVIGDVPACERCVKRVGAEDIARPITEG
jgi:hypothetical protein